MIDGLTVIKLSFDLEDTFRILVKVTFATNCAEVISLALVK